MNLSNFTNNTKYIMLALDQRGSFEKIVGSPDRDLLIERKKQVIEALEDKFSGILLDPQYGLPAYKRAGCTKSFLLCAEKSGYENIEGERLTELEYPVEELKNMGATGIKLLVYFNPFLESAFRQLETSQKVLADCKKFGLPLFFEIVTYGDNQFKNLVTESVSYFLKNKFKPDVFKLQFPGDAQACGQITEMLEGVDWILLTAGVSFYQFMEQLEVACKNGCAGFLAGRSIWQESVKSDISQEDVLKMQERFETIRNIAEKE